MHHRDKNVMEKIGRPTGSSDHRYSPAAVVHKDRLDLGERLNDARQGWAEPLKRSMVLS